MIPAAPRGVLHGEAGSRRPSPLQALDASVSTAVGANDHGLPGLSAMGQGWS
jgi:hypothetical protein